MVIEPNMTRVIEEVRDGKLDYALTKPEDAQMLVSVREVRIWQVIDVFAGLDRSRRRAVTAQRPISGFSMFWHSLSRSSSVR